jgi:hypothetical protein
LCMREACAESKGVYPGSSTARMAQVAKRSSL